MNVIMASTQRSSESNVPRPPRDHMRDLYSATGLEALQAGAEDAQRNVECLCLVWNNDLKSILAIEERCFGRLATQVI